MKQQGINNLFFLGLVGFSISSFIGYQLIPFPLFHYIAENTTTLPVRNQLFWINVVGVFASIFVGLLFYGLLCWKLASPLKRNVYFQKVIYAIRPLGFLFLFPVLFNSNIWWQAPFFLFFLSMGSFFLFSVWFFVAIKQISRKFVLFKQSLSPRIAYALLFVLILFYILYTSYFTIQHHRSFGTSAFDLALVENLYWNSIHGNFMWSSLLEGGANLLGFHTSLIYVTVMPLYWLFPTTETLLIIQSFIIGFAAFPLFLIAFKVFENAGVALLFSFFYLIHPAVGGVNFYDYHELIFSPFLFFSAFYCWLAQYNKRFLFFIILLLTVKESMSIIVFLLGIYLVLSDSKKQGISLILLGIIAYFFFQKIMIPYFAEGKYSQSWYFTWYYEKMIPQNEGPFGMIKTLFVNPIYSLKYFFQTKKILYLFQIFVPLCFLCFFSLRACFLISYGLLISLAASRDPLFELGFQYVFDIIPYAFVASILELKEIQKKGVIKFIKTNQIIFLMFLFSCLVSFHYGMFYPREHFKGGFSYINFKYIEKAQPLYQEMLEFVKEIPLESSVTASENLAPHVSRRKDVQTLRYASYGKDYYFLFRSELNNKENQKKCQKVFNQEEYFLLKKSEHFLLYKKKFFK